MGLLLIGAALWFTSLQAFAVKSFCSCRACHPGMSEGMDDHPGACEVARLQDVEDAQVSA